ncbi:hypothetical protein, partial [Bariatricus sp. HCP28S3_D3]|uniref:hypothetical protein n=1 Tax=Bariatricus sp. HCP28S3_D3 TaxID=3438901 RepID=UPI003F8A3DCE
VSGQFHYIKRALFMPFLLAEILNFQGTEHLIGVGSLSYVIVRRGSLIFYAVIEGEIGLFLRKIL